MPDTPLQAAWHRAFGEMEPDPTADTSEEMPLDRLSHPRPDTPEGVPLRGPN